MVRRPYAPEVGLDDWRDNASCTGYDTEAFFNLNRRWEAEMLCSGCPVTVECATYAIETGSYGFWGGKTSVERRTILRKLGYDSPAPKDIDIDWG